MLAWSSTEGKSEVSEVIGLQYMLQNLKSNEKVTVKLFEDNNNKSNKNENVQMSILS